MYVTIFSEKLDVTPEALFGIVRSFLLSHKAERLLDRAWQQYEARLVNDMVIYITNQRAEQAGQIALFPVVPPTLRIKIILDDWENSPDAKTRAIWNDWELDLHKRELLTHLGWYILSIVDNEQRANA